MDNSDTTESVRMEELHTVTASLEASYERAREIRELTEQRDSLIHQANAQQLREFIHTLHETLSAVKSTVEHKSTVNDNNTNNSNAISLADIERTLDVHDVLDESEHMLSQWIQQLIRQEIKDSETMIENVVQSTREKKKTKNQKLKCASPLQAATEVHQALLRHTSGTTATNHRNEFNGNSLERQDHSQRTDLAGFIVYSLTSPTYNGNTGETDILATHLNSLLNRYMPQDWEKWFLPHNWTAYPHKLLTNIPSHIFHSLGLYRWARSAPPQAILQDSLFPGHCWPVAMDTMSSSPRPRVTILLKQPTTIVDAITVKHVARESLEQADVQLRSAPKRLYVYGYAPCPTDASASCLGLGFDESTAKLLTEIVYDIENKDGNVQSFDIPTRLIASGGNNTVSNGNKDISSAHLHTDEEDDNEGSCSTVKAESSFGSGGLTHVAAITVEIADNWGNSDYTCLYRISVHGVKEYL